MAMTKDEVFGKVRDVIAESLSVEADSVEMGQSFKDDLEADSLDLAEMIMDFEDKFGLGEISEDDAQNILTVQNAVDFIHEALEAQG